MNELLLLIRILLFLQYCFKNSSLELLRVLYMYKYILYGGIKKVIKLNIRLPCNILSDYVDPWMSYSILFHMSFIRISGRVDNAFVLIWKSQFSFPGV